MLAPPFFEGFVLGAGLIVAIGSQNAFVLRQGLKREHVFAVAGVCLGIDVVLIALGAGGFASLIAGIAGATDLIAWAGAIFLFFYGLRAFHGAIKPGTLEARNARTAGAGLRAAALTAMALSLLNPHVYLDTVVLIGGLAAQYPPGPRTAFAAGAMAASLVWFFGLGYGAGKLAPVFAKPNAWRLLDIAIGIVMWTIAGGLIWERI